MRHFAVEGGGVLFIGTKGLCDFEYGYKMCTPHRTVAEKEVVDGYVVEAV